MLLGGAPNLTKIELINAQQDLIFEEKTRSYNQKLRPPQMLRMGFGHEQ